MYRVTTKFVLDLMPPRYVMNVLYIVIVSCIHCWYYRRSWLTGLVCHACQPTATEVVVVDSRSVRAHVVPGLSASHASSMTWAQPLGLFVDACTAGRVTNVNNVLRSFYSAGLLRSELWTASPDRHFTQISSVPFDNNFSIMFQQTFSSLPNDHLLQFWLEAKFFLCFSIAQIPNKYRFPQGQMIIWYSHWWFLYEFSYQRNFMISGFDKGQSQNDPSSQVILLQPIRGYEGLGMQRCVS